MDVVLSDFEKGLILGVLIGEGHFGGDGKQPQITLKMHVRHQRLVRWISHRLPHSRIYGPYHHGGRHYFQLMFRGSALRVELAPTLYGLPWAQIDDYSYDRFVRMLQTYGILDEVASQAGLSSGGHFGSA
jgi:hypothetical protein